MMRRPGAVAGGRRHGAVRIGPEDRKAECEGAQQRGMRAAAARLGFDDAGAMAAMTAKAPFAPVAAGPFPLAAMQCGCWPRQPTVWLEKSRPSKRKRKHARQRKTKKLRRKEEGVRSADAALGSRRVKARAVRIPSEVPSIRNGSGRCAVSWALEHRWSPLERPSTAAVPLATGWC